MKKKAAKKSPARRSGRRRRVGAMKSDTMTQLAGSLAGFLVGSIAAQTVNKMYDKANPGKPLNQKLLAVGIGAIGYIAPKYVGNSPLIKSMGLGISIAGGAILLKDLKAINGIGNKADVLFLPAPGINRTVNGNGISNTVNGTRMSTRGAAMYQG
jgi:hypothetical protein